MGRLPPHPRTPFPENLNQNVEEPRVPRPFDFYSRSVRLGLVSSNLSIMIKTSYWRTRAARNFSTMTELADLLVREHGLSFRTAHRLVSTLANAALIAPALLLTVLIARQGPAPRWPEAGDRPGADGSVLKLTGGPAQARWHCEGGADR